MRAIRPVLSGVVVLAVLVGSVGLLGVHASAASASNSPAVRVSVSGPPEQWAFGGNASGNFSCSTGHCHGVNLSGAASFSISYQYYIEWVVIYTQTNISGTDTEIGVQSALNASASYTITECINVTVGQPCQSMSESANLAGLETATGATNLTPGTTHLNAGTGSPANVSAIAIANANSAESFNFSGSVSFSNSTGSGSANFDFGASETSGITFASPLGVVPVNPVPGNSWNGSAAFTATGSYAYGYSASASLPGAPPESVSVWQHGHVAPSGTVNLTGSDLGAATLWDNFTQPHTNVTAQFVYLQFTGGNVSGTDGWLLGTDAIFAGLLNTSGLGLVAQSSPLTATILPSTTVTSSASENAYYKSGQGFVGASVAGNLSNTTGLPGAPSLSVSAGPEPLSVATQQYSAITAHPSGASGFPVLLVVAAVVVVAVVAGVAIMMGKRAAGRRKPPAPMAPAPPVVAPPPAGPQN